MRPQGGPPANDGSIRSKCRGVVMAVMLSFTPAWARRPASSCVDSPRVFVDGILSKTFLPQPAVFKAWRSISGNSSLKTSD